MRPIRSAVLLIICALALLAQPPASIPGGSGGGGAPSGTAGGYLSGTYPDPAINYQWQSIGSTGIGPTSFTPTHTLDCYDATATTGNTDCVARAGAGQGSNYVFEVQNSSGVNAVGIDATGFIHTVGNIRAEGNNVSSEYFLRTNGIGMGPGTSIGDASGAVVLSDMTGVSHQIQVSSICATPDFMTCGALLNSDGVLNLAPPPTSQSGTSGTAACSTGMQGTQKYTTCYLAAYANTSTAQTYSFPVAFVTTPVLQISGGSCGIYNPSVTASTLTLPANAAMTAESCDVVVLGQ